MTTATVQSYTLDTSGVVDTAFSHDGSRLYVARNDGTVQVFNVATHTLVTTWNVGTALGTISLSADGSTLLATEAQPAAGQITVYAVNTTSGAVTSFNQISGGAYYAVKSVGPGEALLTSPSGVEQLNLTTGTFTSVPTGYLYSPYTTMTADGPLVLLSEPGISNGPLGIYDSRTGTITAAGDDYQANVQPVFNFGIQGISVAAGLAIQFAYHSSINVYDLTLKGIRWVNLGSPMAGYAFSADGSELFVDFTNGTINAYSTSTWNLIGTVANASVTSSTSFGSNGDRLIMTADQRYLAQNADGALTLIDASALAPSGGHNAPTINGTVSGQTTTNGARLRPFAGASITDSNAGATDTLTITLSGNGGTLTDGKGFAGLLANADGSYTLTGSAKAITKELAALVFTPVKGQSGTSAKTTFTLNDSSTTVGAGIYGLPVTVFSYNGNNGASPVHGLVVDAAGDVFGTLAATASGPGSVFELVKTASGYAAPVSVGSGFAGYGSNAGPVAVVIDQAGNLFGTTAVGGDNGTGTVFELVKTASGYTGPQTLFSFNAALGSTPGALVIDAAGNVFGTTRSGGANGGGTLFELANSGTGYGAPTVVAAFDPSAVNSNGNLVIDAAGDLFGISSINLGGVFEVAKTASGYAAPVIVTGNTSVATFSSVLTDAAGNLFVVGHIGSSNALGSVFEFKASSAGYGAAIDLADFNGFNGGNPYGGLIEDAAGDLFGTTTTGGSNGQGTVFELVNSNTGYGNPITLGTINGTSPNASLSFDAAGNLFGTTGTGGGNGSGNVFEITAGQITLASRPDSSTTVTDIVPAVAPVITGTVAGLHTKHSSGIKPFALTVVSDTNANATETLVINIGGNSGTLTDGAGFSGLTWLGPDLYSLTGTAAAVTAELQALFFRPAVYTFPGTPVSTLALSDTSSSFATATINATTTVTDVDAPSALVADAAAAQAATISAFSVNDSAANVAAGIDALAGDSKLTFINLTDWWTPQLVVTGTQYHDDQFALTKIKSNHTLLVRRAAAADAAALAADHNVVAFTIADTAASVGAVLDTLQTASALSRIVLTDTRTPTLTITSAQYVNDAAALDAIVSPHWTKVKGTTGQTLTARGNFVILDGSAGHQTLTAASTGLDTLIGGNGDLLVSSSAGSNVFGLYNNFGVVEIDGFKALGVVTDTLRISKSTFADWTHLLNATVQHGSDLWITVDTNDVLILKNVVKASLSSSQAQFY